jgi:ABC-type nitrate/sulfonate/bicarbonate transport system substrate-binding protein
MKKMLFARKSIYVLIALLIIGTLALSACQPAPVVEEPAAEEPMAEEPAAEEPVAEEPVAEEPAAEEPVAEEPAAEEPMEEEMVCDEPDKVTFQQSWIPDGAQFTAFSAEASGAWEKECLDVELIPGGPQVGALAISLADTGEVDIASMGSTANFVVAINEGANVVAFAQTYQNAPSGIITVIENPEGETFESWESMADVRGKKVGLPAGALVAWTIMMEYHGVEPDEYEVIQTGFDFTPLLDGSVDAIWAYETNFPVSMDLNGYKVEMLRVADNGYQVPGDFIFTNKDYLEENLDILCRFIKGNDAGVRWGLENVEAVADHAVAKHGEEFEMDRDFQVGKAAKAAQLIADWEHPNGLMYIDPENWQRTLDILFEYELIDVKPDVMDVISTAVNECVYGVE